MIINNGYISHFFRAIAKGNPVTRGILLELADTARQIDPDCPYGANGVLDDLNKANLTPLEINKLYKLCNKSPLYLNAIIYGFYLGQINQSDLRKSIRKGKIMPFKEIQRYIKKGITGPCQKYISPNPRFGQYYNPKIK